ncbi:ATP-binding cassette domain-containing protein [Exiguobacterium sp. ERU656]|uniref:ATP-binding cassette domain-containing protein n=1 Tax=Exiguobacterium sp. ERU656 TaxID=2751217 RepID=UPI001BECD4A6|nr:ATP-binding cassette domain-containing protein [Exiguobacterium sp. ERU656]
MPIIFTDIEREKKLIELASEKNQQVIEPVNILSGNVKDLLSVSGLFLAGELASFLGLEAFFNRESSTLSSGEQQLIVLGHELAKRPSSLFLSEPFIFLDTTRKRRLLKLLEEIEKKIKCKIYCSVTSQLEDCEKHDRISLKGDIVNSLSGIAHRYPLQDKYALRVDSLKLYKGECVAVIGANGSGKSTLLKILLGVDKPLYGRVKFRGNKYYVPIDPALTPEFNNRINFSEKKSFMLSHIDWCKDAIYLDEPTAGLEEEMCVKFFNTLHSNASKLIVMATHDLRLIKQSNRVIYLVNGEIAFDGETSIFLEKSWLYK